jgi:hypothetical protein
LPVEQIPAQHFPRLPVSTESYSDHEEKFTPCRLIMHGPGEKKAWPAEKNHSCDGSAIPFPGPAGIQKADGFPECVAGKIGNGEAIRDGRGPSGRIGRV